MVERLTEKVGATGCEYLCIEDFDTVVDKLGKLEDVLEEFNISRIDELHEYLCWEQEQRKELDKIYNVWEKYGCKILQEVDDLLQDGCDAKCILKECDKAETDRDTWKRACELACKWFKQTGFIGDQTKVDYFYQQAKKDGENETA